MYLQKARGLVSKGESEAQELWKKAEAVNSAAFHPLNVPAMPGRYLHGGHNKM